MQLLIRKNHPKIQFTNNCDYYANIAAEITSLVLANLDNKGSSSLMLTGGRSSELLYKELIKNPSFDHTNINYYFGDERCLPGNHLESNYGLVLHSLFRGKIPDQCVVHRIIGEVKN
jgi:6-phosphogluconolactonase